MRSSLLAEPVANAAPGTPADFPVPVFNEETAVSGRVFDPDGTPVEGLLVTLSRLPSDSSSLPVTTTTDTDGSYRFDARNPGSVLLAVGLSPESEFCVPAPASLTLQENRETSGVDFQLEHGLSIVGLVLNDRSGPVENATVTVEISAPPGAAPAGRTLQKLARTDSKGLFEARGINLDAEVIEMEAAAFGFLPTSWKPQLPFDRSQDVILKRLAQVVIEAADHSTSAPLERFRYRLQPLSGDAAQHPFLDWNEPSLFEEAGKAYILKVPPGPWRIQVEELTAIGNRTGRTTETLYQVTGWNDVVRLRL